MRGGANIAGSKPEADRPELKLTRARINPLFVSPLAKREIEWGFRIAAVRSTSRHAFAVTDIGPRLLNELLRLDATYQMFVVRWVEA